MSSAACYYALRSSSHATGTGRGVPSRSRQRLSSPRGGCCARTGTATHFLSIRLISSPLLFSKIDASVTESDGHGNLVSVDNGVQGPNAPDSFHSLLRESACEIRDYFHALLSGRQAERSHPALGASGRVPPGKGSFTREIGIKDVRMTVCARSGFCPSSIEMSTPTVASVAAAD